MRPLRSERRVPRRTCVQCGTVGDKAAFLRIGGKPGRGWEPDPAATRPGRGIYLCREASCVEGFMRRIRTPKGGGRWKMGPDGAALADRIAAWWKNEVKTVGGVDG